MGIISLLCPYFSILKGEIMEPITGVVMGNRAIIYILVIWAIFVALRLAGGVVHLATLGLVALLLGGVLMPRTNMQANRRRQ